MDMVNNDFDAEIFFPSSFKKDLMLYLLDRSAAKFWEWTSYGSAKVIWAARKNFWLYYGNILVTGVRMNENVTDRDVIMHALNQHDTCPCVSSHYPERTPGEIRSMIANSTVRRD